MSGTRKMEKFELEAHITSQLAPALEAVKSNAEPSVIVADEPEERPPSVSGTVKKEEPRDPAALRTRLAAKFVDLAADVNDDFTDFSIGAGAWGVELTAPQGMSTGGGKQALQHLRMRPRRPGYSVLVGGVVNQVDKRADLRDYEHMCMMHEVRFRRRLEITENEWEQFLRKAEVVLEKSGVECFRTGPDQELLKQRANLTRAYKIAAALLVTVLVLIAIVAWRILVSESS